MLKSVENREAFVFRYDWRNPCQNHVFLGNGSLGALFDRTGVTPRDYVYRKGIRRAGNLAGCFQLFTQREEHEARGWQQALDMYCGVLTTSFPCDPHPKGDERRSVDTFFHLEKDLLVIHYEPGSQREPKTIGISFAPREGYPARIAGLKQRAAGERLHVFDFTILADGRRQEEPGPYSLTNDPFREVAWSCQVCMGIEGKATLREEQSTCLAVLSGPATAFVGFTARPSDSTAHPTHDDPPAADLVAECLRAGYQSVREEHAQAWERFWERTELSIPAKDLERIYISSLYYHRVSMGRYTATPSFFPLNAWRSEYMWDDTWMHHAMLSSNQVDLAESVPEHWLRLVDWGRANLQNRAALNKPEESSCSGTLLDYLSLEPEYYRDAPQYRRDGFNLTLSAALSAWRQYPYGGDEKSLEKYYELLKATCEMLLTYGLVSAGKHLWIRRSQTTDESLGNEGSQNSFTNAAMAKALLLNTATVAERRGEESFARSCRQAASRIELANDGSVYLAFAGATEASDDTMLNFFPAMIVEDMAMSRRTLDWYERDCFSTMGAACVKAWIHERAVFPWVHFRVVMSEAMVERPERVERLLAQMQEHDCYQMEWGVLPQIILRAGHADVPLLTPHAAFIQAINLMLLQSLPPDGYGGEGGAVEGISAVDGADQATKDRARWVIKIFPGVPESWLRSRICFKLRTPPGALVEVHHDPESRLSLKLLSCEPVLVKVRMPHGFESAFSAGATLPMASGFDELRYALLECPAGQSRHRLTWGSAPGVDRRDPGWGRETHQDERDE